VEANLKPRNVSVSHSVRFCFAIIILAVASVPVLGQQTAEDSKPAASDLAGSIQELRQQIQELRSAVSEIKSQAAQYRAENQELRKELEGLRTNSSPETNNPVESSSTAAAAGANTTSERVSTLEETTQVLQSQVRTLYQSKVESASKYRVRLSGLVLLNLFHNRGEVDNFDVPTYADAVGPYGVSPGFGATLRQSELGLEVFGPDLAGAKTRGEVQLDFGGGFPASALDGINTGIVRLRTANARLDWENTSVIAGQDSLFISPNSPASFASLLVPSLGYSGNLWAWTPQLRIEHRFHLRDDQAVSIQAGILDNVTGEASGDSHRLPQAGESSGQPAYALRTSWTTDVNGKPLVFGVSGYYSKQDWGPGWTPNGWAAMGDWRIPLASRLELSGEFYRGEAVGGIGGGIGQSVLFNGSVQNPTGFHPLSSAGGWSQLKFSATSRLEFNGAFGTDNPFAAQLHSLPFPVGVYPTVLAANRSEMLNFIYRPRSDLLFSGEFRHLRTTQIGNYYSADQVNLIMGVLF
jgi:regulator of replication initiation timing